jgi:hypothetical protein
MTGDCDAEGTSLGRMLIDDRRGSNNANAD